MKVVVTGSTGYVGSAIVAALRRSGHEVVAVVRTADPAHPWRADEGVHVVVGDIADPGSLAPFVDASDALVHAAMDASAEAAAIDRHFVTWALGTLGRSSAARRLVYTSGVWVLGATGNVMADESSPTDPPAIVGWRPEIERAILRAREGGLSTWVVRPGIVYGGSGGIMGMLLRSLEEEGAVRIVGDGANYWPIVHRDDLADLYVRVLERAPEEPILHAVDGSRLTLRAIAAAIGNGRVRETPLLEARAAMGPFADALALDQRVSSERTMRALGWAPRPASLIDEAATTVRSLVA